MKQILLAAFLFAGSLAWSQSSLVVINELNSDNPGGGGPGGGTDNMEFVELYGPANTSLDSLVLVFFNGGNNNNPDSTSYRALSLTGYSIDEFGFFLLGDSAVVNADQFFPNLNNNIQNGSDAVALYYGQESDFPNGSALTSVNLIDAIVYGTNDAQLDRLIIGLGLDVAVPGYFQQDETAQQAGADLTLSRIPDGGSAFSTTYVAQELTPGTFNMPPCNGGALLFADSTLTQTMCSNVAGVMTWTSFSGWGDSLYVITNETGAIVATTGNNSFDFTGYSGTFGVTAIGYTVALIDSTIEVGDDLLLALATECISFSNTLQVNFTICTGCVGGEVFVNDVASSVVVALDMDPDTLVLSNSSTSLDASYQYALTDTAGGFIAWVNTGFDFNTLTEGVYEVHGVSYVGNEAMLNVGDNISIYTADVCFEWASNAVSIVVAMVPSIVINELNADNPGGPDAAEFVELFGTPNTSLDNLSIVLYDEATVVSYSSFDLDGYSTDENGFFVLGSAGTPNVDFIIPDARIQNGPDAVVLYFGNADQFPNGTAPTVSGMMDAFVYGTGDTTASVLIAALQLETFFPGYTQFDETAQQGGFGVIDLTQSRVPDGGLPFDYASLVLQELTPGTFNIVVLGCTDTLACNYDASATVNDLTCLIIGNQCNDFDPTTINDMVTVDCVCVGTLLVPGCMDPTACNYDAAAIIDDGSCYSVGDACNDGNPSTSGDVVGADCICAGTPVGVENIEFIAEFQLFPNPAHSNTTIQWSQFAPSVVQLSVFDMTGKLQLAQQLNAASGMNKHIVSLETLSRGVYTIRLSDGSNAYQSTLSLQ
jgi:hypothetical protein